MRAPGRRAASGARAYTEENATEGEVGGDVQVVVMELLERKCQRTEHEHSDATEERGQNAEQLLALARNENEERAVQENTLEQHKHCKRAESGVVRYHLP